MTDMTPSEPTPGPEGSGTAHQAEDDADGTEPEVAPADAAGEDSESVGACAEPPEPVAAPADNDAEDSPDGEEPDGEGEGGPAETLGREESRQALYALLFASDRPVSADRLAEAVGDMDREMVETLLAELRAQIDGEDRPYLLKEIAGGYQLVTRPEFSPYIRRMLQVKRSNRMSKAVLETLAIIAYKQPVTRAEVEGIRGVSVAHAFDQLQERKLIKVVGVAETPGRPKLYRTTDEFLMHFGLRSLKELPSIEELREMG